MAEPAQAESGAAVVAAAAVSASNPDIKQEPDPIGLEGIDFSELTRELTSKRPFEDVDDGADHSPEAKRAKTEEHAEEESLEDGLALLVQNALSNVGDLVDHFHAESTPTAEPMNLDDGSPSTAAAEPLKARPSFSADPSAFVRQVNLQALGNTALCLLHILIHQPHDETLRLIRDTDSGQGRSYKQVRQSFEQLRQLYTSKPVLLAQELDLNDDESRTLIDLANLAKLGSWIADGSSESLSAADAHFLAMLGCQSSNMPPIMTELCLGIMMQKANESDVDKEPEKPSEEVRGEVLLSKLEDRLREQHGGEELTPADQKLISNVQSRQEALQVEAAQQAESSMPREPHPAEELFKTFVLYAKGRLQAVSELCNRFGIPVPIGEDEPAALPDAPDQNDDVDLDLDELSSFFERTASGLVQNALAGLTEDGTTVPSLSEVEPAATNGEQADTNSAVANAKIDLMTDYKELEALVAESTSNYVKTTLHELSPVPYQPTVPQSTTETMAAQSPYLQQLQQHQTQHPYFSSYTQPAPEPPAQPPAHGENLPPNQTCPSAILYDKARQAALSKSSAHTRREGLHSTRRPWTQEEEKALMAGLDMVKGPHWSQILTLFGQNGTISDILKDRTQVQLKDKARNLKLFFLKTNSEMPYYLQAVTGELKTRAPTQAARKEAEERARLNSEEEQAKLQGIMALAGGLQHPPQTRTPTPTAVKPAGTPVTQAPNTHVNGSMAHTPGQPLGVAGRPAGIPQTATTAPMQRTALPVGTAQQVSRPGVQATTQQVLQAMPQAPLRPQSQLPRPQMQQGSATHPNPQTGRLPLPQGQSQQQKPILPQGQPHQQQQYQPRPQPVHQQQTRPQQAQGQPPQQTQARPVSAQGQGLPQQQQYQASPPQPQGQTPAQPRPLQQISPAPAAVARPQHASGTHFQTSAPARPLSAGQATGPTTNHVTSAVPGVSSASAPASSPAVAPAPPGRPTTATVAAQPIRPPSSAPIHTPPGSGLSASTLQAVAAARASMAAPSAHRAIPSALALPTATALPGRVSVPAQKATPVPAATASSTSHTVTAAAQGGPSARAQLPVQAPTPQAQQAQGQQPRVAQQTPQQPSQPRTQQQAQVQPQPRPQQQLHPAPQPQPQAQAHQQPKPQMPSASAPPAATSATRTVSGQATQAQGQPRPQVSQPSHPVVPQQTLPAQRPPQPVQVQQAPQAPQASQPVHSVQSTQLLQSQKPPQAAQTQQAPKPVQPQQSSQTNAGTQSAASQPSQQQQAQKQAQPQPSSTQPSHPPPPTTSQQQQQQVQPQAQAQLQPRAGPPAASVATQSGQTVPPAPKPTPVPPVSAPVAAPVAKPAPATVSAPVPAPVVASVPVTSTAQANAPKQREGIESHDNAAEAALLEGLQAVVAQSLA